MYIKKVRVSIYMNVFLMISCHILYMLKKFPNFKNFHGYFSTRIKTVQFVIPLIVLGKLKF